MRFTSFVYVGLIIFITVFFGTGSSVFSEEDAYHSNVEAFKTMEQLTFQLIIKHQYAFKQGGRSYQTRTGTCFLYKGFVYSVAHVDEPVDKLENPYGFGYIDVKLKDRFVMMTHDQLVDSEGRFRQFQLKLFKIDHMSDLAVYRIISDRKLLESRIKKSYELEADLPIIGETLYLWGHPTGWREGVLIAQFVADANINYGDAMSSRNPAFTFIKEKSFRTYWPLSFGHSGGALFRPNGKGGKIYIVGVGQATNTYSRKLATGFNINAKFALYVNGDWLTNAKD